MIPSESNEDGIGGAKSSQGAAVNVLEQLNTNISLAESENTSEDAEGDLSEQGEKGKDCILKQGSRGATVAAVASEDRHLQELQNLLLAAADPPILSPPLPQSPSKDEPAALSREEQGHSGNIIVRIGSSATAPGLAEACPDKVSRTRAQLRAQWVLENVCSVEEPTDWMMGRIGGICAGFGYVWCSPPPVALAGE
jgi:hypothetical protein